MAAKASLRSGSHSATGRIIGYLVPPPGQILGQCQEKAGYRAAMLSPGGRVDGGNHPYEIGTRSGAFLCCALQFRPSAFLRCGDPCPCFRAQSAPLSGQLRLRRRISTREEGAGLLETGDFGINLSNQLGCIHVGQCKPVHSRANPLLWPQNADFNCSTNG